MKQIYIQGAATNTHSGTRNALGYTKHTNRSRQTRAVCSDVRSELRLGLINNSPCLITALHGVPDPRVPRTALNETRPHSLSDKCCIAMRICYFREIKVAGYKLEMWPM